MRHDWNAFLKEPPSAWVEAFRVTEPAILRCRDRVRSDGADFLLVTLTSGAQLSDKLLLDLNNWRGEGNYDQETTDRFMRGLAEEKGVDLFQLLPIFRESYMRTGSYYHGFEKAEGMGSDGHWDEMGHRLAAEAVHSFLSGYVPRKLAIAAAAGQPKKERSAVGERDGTP